MPYAGRPYHSQFTEKIGIQFVIADNDCFKYSAPAPADVNSFKKWL